MLKATLVCMLVSTAAVEAYATDGMPFFNACVSDPPQSAGVYRFSTREYAPEQIKRNVYASGGGIAADNYYYGVRYEVIGGIPVVECTSYVLRDWSIEDNYPNGKITNVATDLAYFAPRDEAYGCFFNESGTGYIFGKCRLSQFSCVKIADLETAFAAMDFDAGGTLYAIDWKGVLNIVDTATGALTPVGETGKPAGIITGGAIDRTTGTFYYSVKTDAESAIYAVDLTTAAATKVYDLENNEQVGGMYFPETYDNAAPAASGNPTVSFPVMSLEGTVRFRAPQKTVGGDLLTEAVTYHIEANGKEVATGTAQYADGYITAQVAVETAGQYCFSLYFSNEAGRGPRSKASQYVGPDTPRAPGNPRLTYNAGTVKLFWNAAGSTGVNGGNIDRSNLYYKITRQPDGEVYTAEASGWSQQIEMPAERTTYRYDIQTVAGGIESEPASTPEFSLGPVVPPFSESFSQLVSTIGWTWINNDSYIEDNYNTTKGLRLVTMNAPEEGTFIVTPEMSLVAGNKYEISVALMRGNTNATETFELVAGTSPAAGALTANTVIEPSVLDVDEYRTFTGTFVPEETGSYYFAIHGVGDAGKMLYLKQFDISKGVSDGAPGEVTGLEAVADATGVHKVKVSFTAPTATIGGGTLTSLTSAELLRDNESIKTVTEGVAPGAELVIIDDLEPSVGEHTYTVVCHNGSDNGVPVSVKVWVGFNRPEPVEWVKVKETSPLGTVDVSWAPAATDIDGKPLDNAEITYVVYNREYGIVKTGLKETSVTLRPLEPQAEQDWVQYRVAAVSEGGESELAKSMLVPVGLPDKAPWHESWAGKTATHLTGTTANSVGDTWQVVGGFEYKDRVVDPQDADGGMMGLENTSPEERIAMFTGKIDLSEVSSPAFTFWVYNYVGDNGKENANELEVKIIGDNDDDFQHLQTIVIGQTGPQRQWNKVSVPLTGYEGQTVRLRVEAFVVTAIYVHMDNLEVNTSSPCNLYASGITAPVSVNPGEEFEVSFTICNNGDSDIAGAKAVLLRDGSEVAVRELGEVKSGSSVKVAFTEMLGILSDDQVTYVCEARADGDLVPTDNQTEGLTVAVRRNGLPAVSSLDAAADNSCITLSWDAPDLSEAAPEPTTEGFETATAWTSEVSGWTFHDLDRATIGGIGKKQLPISGQQSFFVITDTYPVLNYPNDGDRFKAHAGNKSLWSMYSMRGDTYVQSDDWAVTPELYGGPQTVSLWASSFEADSDQKQYLESFEILASADGTEPGDFVTVETVKDVPAEWTRYEFFLPSGTRHMAIRGISYDKYLLMVDDVEFIPAGGSPRQLTLVGYKVWRDGVCVTASPLSETSYVDTDVEPGRTYRYRVTADYGVDGESAGSAEVETALKSGVGSLRESGGLAVTGGEGFITVSGADGMTVRVSSIDGRAVAVALCGEATRIAVTPGVYVVTVGGRAFKVIVR